jgi:hypothetical protein
MNTRKLSVLSGLFIFATTPFLSWFVISGADREESQQSETEAAPVLIMNYRIFI